MDNKYIKNAKILKALGEPKRLCIIDMLSKGELCACKILEEFHITQPTLSHDMKVLCDVGLVKSRRDGKWTHYSLNEIKIKEFKVFLDDVFNKNEEINCICRGNK
ncbi:ArsR family transcriptional regulator [Clostridium novyi A str. 4552]|uniref:ArsR family transcriptional regulator n=1 Tax=Clostridium novyi A str. 4552 TaxID=1444289 RepID=A0A0A0IEJ7_CLONO|nr:metalloregulator ArsR/SmtB family transcription factor [Clostridium novyi]KGM98030.1 ArsR family transcriptional regulator [Clostridium novyi A str. 4552]